MMLLLQAAVSNPQDVYNLSEHIGLVVLATAALGSLSWILGKALLRSHRRIMDDQLTLLRGEQEAHQNLAASKLDTIEMEISDLTNTVRSRADQDDKEHRDFRNLIIGHGERIGRLEGAVFRYGRRATDPGEEKLD